MTSFLSDLSWLSEAILAWFLAALILQMPKLLASRWKWENSWKKSLGFNCNNWNCNFLVLIKLRDLDFNSIIYKKYGEKPNCWLFLTKYCQDRQNVMNITYSNCHENAKNFWKMPENWHVSKVVTKSGKNQSGLSLLTESVSILSEEKRMDQGGWVGMRTGKSHWMHPTLDHCAPQLSRRLISKNFLSK